MARKCTICSHDRRKEIDEALIIGASYRSIAQRFGVSCDSVRRHRLNHLPNELVKSEKAREAARSDNLADKMAALESTALGILERAEKGGDLNTAIRAIREVRGVIETMAKIFGNIRDQQPIITGVIFLPQKQTPEEWIAEHGGELAPTNKEGG